MSSRTQYGFLEIYPPSPKFNIYTNTFSKTNYTVSIASSRALNSYFVLTHPRMYTRTPYCFQSNYGSSSYSGPSTSFNPSFERDGTNYPPSHCDVNRYHSAFAPDPRLRSSASIAVSSMDYQNMKKDTTPDKPSNLRACEPRADFSFPPLMFPGEEEDNRATRGLRW